MPPEKNRRIFGIEFVPWRRQQIVDAAVVQADTAPRSGVRLVVTANLDHVVNLRRNARFRNAYAHAWLATADGMPVYLYARLQGVPIPERVVGGDLFPELLNALSPVRHRPFFVVSQTKTGDNLRGWLETRGFSPAQMGIEVPPFGFESDLAYGERLANEIRRRATTHLFFGVGAPKSEVWIHEHREQLGDLYAFGFGSALDFFAGTARRAPRLLRKVGLEWAWRVLSEPRRLARRYFVDSWMFAGAVFDDLRTGGQCPFVTENGQPHRALSSLHD